MSACSTFGGLTFFSARTPSKPHASPLWRGGGGGGNVFSIQTKKKEFVLLSTKINHKGQQRTANDYAEERRIYKDLVSKNNNVDILNSASRIL